MSVSSVLNTATSGLKAASLKVETASHNIANLHTEGYTRAEVSSTSLVTGTDSGAGVQAQIINSQIEGENQDTRYLKDVINLVEAKAAYKANAEVLKTAEELGREVVDITL